MSQLLRPRWNSPLLQVTLYSSSTMFDIYLQLLQLKVGKYKLKSRRGKKSRRLLNPRSCPMANTSATTRATTRQSVVTSGMYFCPSTYFFSPEADAHGFGTVVGMVLSTHQQFRRRPRTRRRHRSPKIQTSLSAPTIRVEHPACNVYTRKPPTSQLVTRRT